MARLLLGFLAVLLNHFLFAAGSFEVGLSNNSGTCFGRVEILTKGTWGTVCGKSWSISDAALVCKELNCGRAVTAHVWALFGKGSGHIWSVNCEGKESISECDFINSTDCSNDPDAEVVCSASLVVIIGGVVIAVVFILSFTIIIILVRRKRRSQKQQISTSDAVTMHDVVHEDRYEESVDDDDDDYEKVDVDVDGDRDGDVNSSSEQDYVNMDEPQQSNVETDDSEQDYVNVETEDSDGDYVNVESENSDGDYVNVEITEDRHTVDNNLDA